MSVKAASIGLLAPKIGHKAHPAWVNSHVLVFCTFHIVKIKDGNNAKIVAI